MKQCDQQSLQQWWKANGYPQGACELIQAYQLDSSFAQIYGHCSSEYFSLHPDLQYGLAFFDEFSSLMDHPPKPLPFLGPAHPAILKQEAYRFWTGLGVEDIQGFVARYNLESFVEHVLDGWSLDEVLLNFPEHADGLMIGNALWWHQKLSPHPLNQMQKKALLRLQPLVDLWDLAEPNLPIRR